MATVIKWNAAGLRRVQAAYVHGLYNAALAVEAQAKRNVHVITGNLRRSIHSAAFGAGQQLGADEGTFPRGGDFVAYVGTNTGYGVYEEFGTRYRPPHPYLLPARDALLGQLPRLIEAGATAYLRRSGG